jgi:hypothetical protein
MMRIATVSTFSLVLMMVACAFWGTASVRAEDQAFLSVFSPITGQTVRQSYSAAPTLSYLHKQAVAYDLRLEQLLSMPINLQREVLSMDGVQRPLSREERHALVPFHRPVPSAVINGVVHANYISDTVLKQYGITIPNSMSRLPEGFQSVLLGNRLLFINAANSVMTSVAL